MRINTIKKTIVFIGLVSIFTVFPVHSNPASCDAAECSKEFGKLLKYAKNGSPTAQYLVAVIYREGQFVEKSDTEAFKWMRKSAKQKIGIAEFELALMYKRGVGTSEDLDAFESYLELAIKRKVEKALLYKVTEKIILFQQSPSAFTKQQRNNIVSELSSLTEQSSEAQYLLSRLYETGAIVGKNIEKAYELNLMSANRGNEKALRRVALMGANISSDKKASIESRFHNMEHNTLLVEGEQPEFQELLAYSVKYIQSLGVYDGRGTGSRLVPCTQTSFCKVYKNDFTNGVIFDQILSE